MAEEVYDIVVDEKCTSMLDCVEFSLIVNNVNLARQNLGIWKATPGVLWEAMEKYFQDICSETFPCFLAGQLHYQKSGSSVAAARGAVYRIFNLTCSKHLVTGDDIKTWIQQQLLNCRTLLRQEFIFFTTWSVEINLYLYRYSPTKVIKDSGTADIKYKFLAEDKKLSGMQTRHVFQNETFL